MFNFFKQSISLQLPDRKYNEAISLEVVKDCPADIIKFLKAQYQLNDNDVYKVNGPVNLNRLVDFGKKIDVYRKCSPSRQEPP